MIWYGIRIPDLLPFDIPRNVIEWFELSFVHEFLMLHKQKKDFSIS